MDRIPVYETEGISSILIGATCERVLMRQCRDCGKEKTIDQFDSAGTIKGIKYYRGQCKSCYSKFKSDIRSKVRQWYLEFKKELSCKECGNSDHRVLEFHRPDTSDKTATVGKMVNNGCTIESIQKEIDKCITLCANCHRIETYEEFWYKS